MAYVGTPIDTQNQFQSLVGKRFSGDASTTGFTLDVAPTSTLDIEVFVENVRQDPNSAYSLSGTTLTFAAAPPSGTNNIYVVHQAKAVGTITAGAGTVNADSFDNTVISGHTALAATPADTDEFLVSDAGTIKRIDYSYIKTVNTPAFHATMSGNQDLPNNTATKVDFDTEVFDTDSDYDTTNKRFLPTVSGKYFITFSMSLSSGASIGGVEVKLRKNGTDVYITEQAHYYGNAAQTYVISGIISCNGSSDYIEAFAEQDRGSTAPIQGTTTQSFFQGYKLIGA